jgi:hypothetical protein
MSVDSPGSVGQHGQWHAGFSWGLDLGSGKKPHFAEPLQMKPNVLALQQLIELMRVANSADFTT